MDNNNGNVGHWASIVSYRECQRNYPTRRGRGRHAVDGCLEFLPVEDDRNPEALLCAACGCHRNFHRREEVPIRVEPGMAQILQQLAAAPPPPHLPILAPHNPVPVPAPAPAAVNANQEENLGDGEVEEEPEPRRRGRTRLKQGQKEAMRRYAERLEWSLQGHNEEELFRFCSEIGIIPEVFKVWMKNNRRKYVDGRETSSSADGF